MVDGVALWNVGRYVGSIVGMWDGITVNVGKTVGTYVGEEVGAYVGPNVGLCEQSICSLSVRWYSTTVATRSTYVAPQLYTNVPTDDAKVEKKRRRKEEADTWSVP